MPEATEPVRVTNFRSLVGWALAAYLVLQLLDAIAVTLLVFGFAFFLALVLDPPIRWLDRHGLSRGAAVGAMAALLLIGLGLAVYYAVPPLVDEAGALARAAPDYASRLQMRAEDVVGRYPSVRNYLAEQNLGGKLVELGQKILPQVGRYSLNIVTGLFSLVIVLILTLYTLAAPRPLLRGVMGALPRAYRHVAIRSLSGTSQQLRNWVRATFWMMLIVGIMSGAGLWVIGVPSPALFGLIAGIGEAIPTVGPILSAIPPLLVALADEPVKALWVALVFLVVQQVENNLLVPRIMASTLNLHPVSVLFCVVTMGALLGPLGILLATPLCAIIKVVYREYRAHGRRLARRAALT